CSYASRPHSLCSVPTRRAWLRRSRTCGECWPSGRRTRRRSAPNSTPGGTPRPPGSADRSAPHGAASRTESTAEPACPPPRDPPDRHACEAGDEGPSVDATRLVSKPPDRHPDRTNEHACRKVARREPQPVALLEVARPADVGRRADAAGVLDD